MADNLFSKIEEAKKVAARLAERSAAVTTAVQRRDSSRSRLFANLHQLDTQLRGMGRTRALKALKAQYQNTAYQERPRNASTQTYVSELEHQDIFEICGRAKIRASKEETRSIR
jgi:hypothetical protein